MNGGAVTEQLHPVTSAPVAGRPRDRTPATVHRYGLHLPETTGEALPDDKSDDPHHEDSREHDQPQRPWATTAAG